jgi:fumarate hydratase subunit beta
VAVYLTAIGGWSAGTLFALKVNVKNIYWLELGTPQAIWVFEAEDFGPLLVTTDTQGQDLYKKLKTRIQKTSRIYIERCNFRSNILSN